MAKTIHLKGEFVRKEDIATAALTPGHLIMFDGTAGVKKHNVSGGTTRRAFALENDLIGRSISTAYAQNETVQYGVFSQGAEVLAWLKAGQNVTKGAALCSNGDGTLRASGSVHTDDDTCAFALESINANGGVDVAIKVEVN